MTEVTPVQTAEDMMAIHEGLVRDGSSLILPTHSIRRDGKLIGAVSVGAIPTLHFWFDREQGQALQSIRAINKTEDILKGRSIQHYQTICQDHSPFAAVIDRLGFRRPFEDTTTLYIKNLRGD